MKITYWWAEEEVVWELLDKMTVWQGKLNSRMIPMFQGGRFKRKELSEEEQGIKDYWKYLRTNWNDYGAEPKDYITLIINILMYWLANEASLDTQMLMSANG